MSTLLFTPNHWENLIRTPLTHPSISSPVPPPVLLLHPVNQGVDLNSQRPDASRIAFLT